MCFRTASRLLATLAAGLSVSVGAGAQPSAAAEALFREGREALEAKDFDTACGKLQRSHNIEAAPGTLALLAYCHEQQGKTASAWQEYLEVARAARDAKQTERERIARESAERLEPTLARLKLNVLGSVTGLEVLRNGQKVPQEAWGVAVPIDPGSWRVRATAPGHSNFEKQVTVTPSSSVTVLIPELKPLGRVSDPASTPRPLGPSSTHEAPARAEAPTSTPWFPIALVGVGAVGLAGGAAFGVLAKNKYSESDTHCNSSDVCDPQGLASRDDAFRLATYANISAGAGLAFAAVGTYLWATHESPAQQVGVRVQVRGSTLELGGKF